MDLPCLWEIDLVMSSAVEIDVCWVESFDTSLMVEPWVEVDFSLILWSLLLVAWR